MTSGPVSLFVNPTAGRGRAGRRLSRISALFEQVGIDFEPYQSQSVGDLEDQVRKQVNRGTHRIVVAGGDGSVHEAVNGIMRADKPARLGVIPSGTGNDFAKACHIPLDWEHATQLLAERIKVDATSRCIDIGRMNERYFANGAGIGFDAKVTKVARSYRWPIGDLVYLFAIFRCLVDGVATPDVTITSDELTTHGPITLASISNGAWIGGMFHIAPMADNSDGKLELLIANPVSRMRILFLLPKIISGKHLGESEVRHASVGRVAIDCSEEVPSHLDGEVGTPASRFVIEILPAALNLL
jgi:diacylglycerol kinase (ATP)